MGNVGNPMAICYICIVMLYSSQDLFFSVALGIYVAGCIICGLVRWGHRCGPYNRHQDYYFPAWRTVVFCFLSNLVVFPGIFMPQDADAQMLLRAFFILSSPFCCAMLIFSYFGSILQFKWWRKPLFWMAVPFALVFLTGTVLALLPGTQLGDLPAKILVSIAGILALVYLGVFCQTIWMVARAMKRVSAANYSNPEDFPQHYAARIIWLPFVHILICWTASIIGTPLVMSCALLLLTALYVVFLISALSPHRNVDVHQLEAQPEESSAPETESLSPEKKAEILQTIRKVVEEDKAYLDSHLTLTALAHSCGYNRSYVSMVMNESLGGFFYYVNSCRLAHAERFRKENPDASIEQMAVASGFAYRQTYYSVKAKMGSYRK